jgi:hypothetical protein
VASNGNAVGGVSARPPSRGRRTMELDPLSFAEPGWPLIGWTVERLTPQLLDRAEARYASHADKTWSLTDWLNMEVILRPRSDRGSNSRSALRASWVPDSDERTVGARQSLSDPVALSDLASNIGPRQLPCHHWIARRRHDCAGALCEDRFQLGEQLSSIRCKAASRNWCAQLFCRRA